ncbi:MAG: hypothetical protein Q7T11_06065 [Deltaproteobacteria bacterium]|nr:hypothetical protein [Deltaproteobacteria bacterium]
MVDPIHSPGASVWEDLAPPPAKPKKKSGPKYEESVVDPWLGVRHRRGSSIWLMGGGNGRAKTSVVNKADEEIATWIAAEKNEFTSLTGKLDAFEKKVRFPDNAPAIYGGMGHFYSATTQELKSGGLLYLKVAIPDEPPNRRIAQYKAIDYFQGRVFLRSKEKGGPDIPLEPVEDVPWNRGNGMTEHSDNSQMSEIALNGKKMFCVKMAFRVADPSFLDRIWEREFFDIVQPGREGETVLISNGKDNEFKVDHAADTHVRLRDYRNAVDFMEKMSRRIDYLYSKRAISAEACARWKRGWLAYVKNLEVKYAENVRAWLAWEKERYLSGEIDFVVIHGDEIDNVNDSQKLTQRPFNEENTRYLAYLLREAGIPVMVETGNHTRHRPNYYESHHAPHVNSNPALGEAEQTEEEKHFAKIVEMDKGYGTLNYFLGIFRQLMPVAAGEPQIIEKEGDGTKLKNFFWNMGILFKGLFVSTGLFDEHPTRQTADDTFRGNQYLYVNSEPNFALHHKGHTFLMTDTGAEDFRFMRAMVEMVPDWMKGGLGYALIPFMPWIWDQALVYIGEQEVRAKGYPDAAFKFFVETAHRARNGEKVTPITYSSHFPWFHYLPRMFLNDYESNTVNRQSRSAMLLYFWYFKPMIETVISGHIHNWEAFAFDFDLPEEKQKELSADLKNLFEKMMTHRAETSEELQKEFRRVWKKYDLDDHLVMPKEITENNGQDLAAILKARRENPERFDPLFITLEAIGPTSNTEAAGILTQTVKNGETVDMTATSLFFNRNGTVTAVPIEGEAAEVERRKAKAVKTYPRRPPIPPVNREDPYEGIL